MIQIREASMENVAEVAELFDAYRVFYRKASDLDGALQFLTERVKNNESVIFIAFEGDVAIGFTQLYPVFSSTRMKRIWLLNDLYISPEARGKGISKLLLDRAKQLAEDTGAAAVTLETEKSNIIGNRLYPSSGFSLEDTVNHYYWDNTTPNL